ncbi:chemotaxis protein CheW [Methylophaga sp. OBS1]|jgi:chemotaxis signal transduction protein|uniref:chemotaxis protein CheW n=1 Tax=Methylophaga sp. OBS1 TaxID=2991933 RepID=UPI002255748E|nr:chemotaxis protein CheW [Methylophaga sp. OBS1]MCX4192960.1 chemotaxis protein CheW [Methylophaga sp. OBS1]
MAKTQIYQQKDALSVYFRDMLAETRHVDEIPAPVTDKSPADIKSGADTEATPTTSTHEAAASEVDSALGQETTSVVSSHKLLLCQVAGIKLAFEVSMLSNIVHWPKSGLNQLPGRQDWQLGLFRDRERSVEVIDIRHLLQSAPSPVEQPSFILLMAERHIGIACDGINQIINIDNDQINWRRDTTQRPWFSGVIADSMHSILDLPALFTALEKGEMA